MERMKGPEGHTGERASVLVVDDEVAIRESVRRLLEASGFAAETAATGEEAMASLARRAVDLVLLDINMPGASGLEVASRIRSDPRLSDVAILCATGLDDPEHRVAALETGADDFIGKPFTSRELLTRVRVLVDRRRAQRELNESLARIERLERWRDDLVNMLVHDMRNLLAGTIGYLDLAMDCIHDPEAAARDIQKARATATRLQKMLGEALDLRRLEDGKMPLEFAWFDPEPLLAELVDGLGAFAATRRKSLTVLPSPERTKVYADRTLLARVIENLVVNAVKYSGKGVHIFVGVVPALPGWTGIFVDDEGPGIAPEVRARLFEKFAATAKLEPGEERGRGFGLAFVKLAVEAQGGKVSAQGREPTGTRFLVELPGAPREERGEASG